MSFACSSTGRANRHRRIKGLLSPVLRPERVVMNLAAIDRPDYRWLVLLDDAGSRHRYVRRAPAAHPTRPQVHILSHGLVRFTEDRGVPILDGRRLPAAIVVERQGDCFLFEEV